MAISPVHEFPVGGLAEHFLDGEHLLAVASPYTSTPKGTYYLSRRMRFAGGVYQIKAYVDDAATWWVGASLTSQRMVWSNVIGQVEEGEIYIAPGVQRLDIILQNLPVAPTPCYVIFSLWQDGQLVYASRAEHWRWDTVPIPDEDLPQIEDPRLAMPVWVLLPNWRNGVLERLEWLTDVLESETGAEQRRALRANPRRSIEADFLREGPMRSRLDLFFNGIGQQEILVPLWHEAVKMVQGIRIGATGVSFSAPTTSMREFRTGDLVFVNNGDPNDYDILEVAEVEPARFGWRKRPVRNWPAGTRIYPLRKARIMDGPQLSNVSAAVGTTSVRFELSEPDIRTPAWGRYFEDIPVFTFKPNRRTPIQLEYSRNSYVLDNNTSAIRVTDLSGESKIGMRMAFTIFQRPNVAAFRSMLAAARGRAASFYLPSFTRDILPRKPIIPSDGYIESHPVGFHAAMARPHPTRWKIMIEPADGGEPLFREVTNIVPVHRRVDRSYQVRVQSRPETIITSNGIFPAGGGFRLYSVLSGGMHVAIFSGSTGEFIGQFGFAIGWEDEWIDPVPPEEELPAAEARWAANVESLTALLNSLLPDSTIVIHTGPHFAALMPNWLTPDLIAAIERCGGTQEALENIKLCGNYMLLGVPELGAGKGIERRSGDTNHAHSSDDDINFLVELQNGRPIAIEGEPRVPLVAERFVLDSPLPYMDVDDIERISFISLARLDQDAVEIRHVTAGSYAAEVSLVARQHFNRRKQGQV